MWTGQLALTSLDAERYASAIVFLTAAVLFSRSLVVGVQLVRGRDRSTPRLALEESIFWSTGALWMPAVALLALGDGIGWLPIALVVAWGTRSLIARAVAAGSQLLPFR